MEENKHRRYFSETWARYAKKLELLRKQKKERRARNYSFNNK